MKKTLIGLALLLAACGGTEVPEAAPAPPPPAPAPAPAPEPEPEPEPEPDEMIAAEDVVDILGAAYFLDMVWADMDAEGRAELCVGVGIFGAQGAAEIVVGEALSFPVDEVADWLERTCS